MNILLTNVGRRTYFIDFLSDIAKKRKLSIHVSDCDFKSAALYTKTSKQIHITPQVVNNEKKYLKAVFKIVKKSKISLIIPLTDLDLEVLSKNKLSFKKIGCDVAVSKNIIINTCYDKKKLYHYCKKKNINYPNLYFNKKQIKNYPIIVKEAKGSGSKNLNIYRNKKFIFPKGKKFIIQKYIKGTEYNIDIFNDTLGNFVSCCIKKKLLMRSGETDICEIIRNKNLENFSKKLSKTFKHIGNLDCDVVVSRNKKSYLIDANPRFGGGYPFTHLAGLNYLEALIKDFKKEKIKIKNKPKLLIGMKGIEIKSILKR